MAELFRDITKDTNYWSKEEQGSEPVISNDEFAIYPNILTRDII